VTTRPNIIVLIADDHRAESLGSSGCTEVRTPYLDALAASGTAFAGHHCQGSMHPAVCVPSRASLMTGRNIFRSSCNPSADDYADGPGERASFTIPADLPTFPQRLRESGYRTHAIGKWHNDRDSFARSFGSAERTFFGGMSDHDRVPLNAFDPTGRYGQDAVIFEAGHSTDLFADSARRFLRTVERAQPFCLYVAFTAPHDPRTPPPAFAVEPSVVSLPANFEPVHPFDNGEALVRDEVLEQIPRPPDAVRQHIADYYGMIAHLDDAIGSILATAKDAGLLDDTIVVYTADHGLALGQHGLMGKQNLYEHSLRVPLLLAGPGIPHGRRVPALTWHSDTRATLLDYAGLPLEEESEGTSLLGLMLGRAPPPRTHFSAAYRASQRMIRDDRFKLIRYVDSTGFTMPSTPGYSAPTPGSSLEQLFDLQEDPLETANLVFKPELQGIRRELGEALASWQSLVGDPFAQLFEAR
jgi:arylsulfatase A-like enzyme